MNCDHCGCEAHCGMSCTDCWECPDCHCQECRDSDKEDTHTNITTADLRD